MLPVDANGAPAEELAGLPPKGEAAEPPALIGLPNVGVPNCAPVDAGGEPTLAAMELGVPSCEPEGEAKPSVLAR